MEGTEVIIIRQPAVKVDAGTQVRCPDKEIRAWAVRTDRGGRNQAYRNIMAGNWTTVFRVNNNPSLTYISERWEVVDRYNLHFTIESVQRRGDSITYPFLDLFCLRAEKNKEFSKIDTVSL